MVHLDRKTDLLGNYSPILESLRVRPRRRALPTYLALTVVGVVALLILVWSQSQPDHLNTLSPLDALHPLASLNGPPTMSFRENLRPELKYITSWISAGWTNDVITYANLIYLGLITDHIPVLPMFTPSHIEGHLPTMPFGDIFDVPRLRQILGKPILEWRDVKDSASNKSVVDDLGCWNIWESVQYREKFPRVSVVPGHLKLDLSYTKAPASVKLIPDFEHDMHSAFWNLATLAFPEGRAASLGATPLQSPLHHVSLPPDEQMLCFDYLYYLCAHKPFELEADYSPAWRFVGQHLHWAQSLEDIAETSLREAMGLREGENIPPWITVHVRHTDFKDWCGDVAIDDCFAPLSAFARRVEEVKAELLRRKGIAVEHVIMTSDESDPGWWSDVTQLGWLRINHLKLKEVHGAWYTILVDAVVQSNGQGFVGTARSTMSILAHRRVESWHHGVAVDVKWGTPNADEH